MASEYLLSLINDVLDMRKIDHNDMKLFEESVNLRAIIENCRDILEAKLLSRKLSWILQVWNRSSHLRYWPARYICGRFL